MSDPKPLVYLLLGAAGSGRREILADLIEGGLAEADKAAVLLSEGELPDHADSRLTAVGRWKWTPDHAIAASVPPGATHVFFVADGRRNPVDQIEAAKAWIDAGHAGLASILCVVNCQLIEKHHELLPWYDACIHFSDVVLLNRREGVANKAVSDFRSRYLKKFYPCLFEFVRDGRVANPSMILSPVARRMAHLFDEEPELPEGVEIVDEEPVDEDEDAEADLGDEEEDEDPYLARRQGGRRVIELPDIAKFLG